MAKRKRKNKARKASKGKKTVSFRTKSGKKVTFKARR